MKREFTHYPHAIPSPATTIAVQVSAGTVLTGSMGAALAASFSAPAPSFDAPIRAGELTVALICCGPADNNLRVKWIDACIENPVSGEVQTSFMGPVCKLVADAQAVIVQGMRLSDVLPVVWRARCDSPKLAIIVALPGTSPAERAELLGQGADDIIDHSCQAEEAAARLRACYKRYAAYAS